MTRARRTRALSPGAWRAALLVAALLTPLASLQARDAARPLRVLQWNVGTLNPRALRLPPSAEASVVDTIARAAPDVVTLQEVGSTAQARRLRDGLRARGLGYEAHVLVVDPGHPDGLLVVLGRAPVRARRTLHTAGGFRSLAVDLGGLWVVGVHAPTGSDPGARRAYFDEVLAWAARLPGPCVLAGDFNLGPRGGAGLAAVLPWLRRGDRATYARITDAFPARTRSGPTTSYLLHLDHVVGRGVRLVSEQVLRGRRRGLMDHDPVLATLQAASSRGLAGAVGAP